MTPQERADLAGEGFAFLYRYMERLAEQGEPKGPTQNPVALMVEHLRTVRPDATNQELAQVALMAQLAVMSEDGFIEREDAGVIHAVVCCVVEAILVQFARDTGADVERAEWYMHEVDE